MVYGELYCIGGVAKLLNVSVGGVWSGLGRVRCMLFVLVGFGWYLRVG